MAVVAKFLFHTPQQAHIAGTSKSGLFDDTNADKLCYNEQDKLNMSMFITN